MLYSCIGDLKEILEEPDCFFTVFWWQRRIDFKSSLNIYSHPWLLNFFWLAQLSFRIEETIHTKAAPVLRIVCILGVVLPGAQMTYLRGGLLGGTGSSRKLCFWQPHSQIRGTIKGTASLTKCSSLSFVTEFPPKGNFFITFLYLIFIVLSWNLHIKNLFSWCYQINPWEEENILETKKYYVAAEQR